MTVGRDTDQSDSPRRVAQVICLRPEFADEYLKAHSEVWPGVLERLRASNVTNYSIFHHDDLLFSYFEYVGADFERDMDAMAADPTTQKWWRWMNPMQKKVGETDGEWWTTIDEVFRLDD